MARSHSSHTGTANPWLIGAVALLIMATFFGPETGLFAPAGPPSRLAELSEIDDELAPLVPSQRAIQAPDRALTDPDYVATPLHFFSAEALVLSRKAYRYDDESAISPLDLMLGWGPMSNPAIVSEIRISQSGRFGYVRTEPDSTLDLDEVSPFWTNVHIIPGDAEIATALDAIAEGMVVRLEGVLVDVNGPEGWHWRTSTSRTDSGAGACEILLVTAVHVVR